MSAQRCLTPWNCPIGRPNCTRSLGVLGGGLDAPLGDADELGGRERRGQREHGRRLYPVELSIRADDRAVADDLRDAPGRVDARQLRARHPRAGEVDGEPRRRRPGARRRHQHVGERAAQDRSDRAPHDEAVLAGVGLEPAAGTTAHCGDELARRQRGQEHLVRGLVRRLRDHGGRERRREDRTRRERVPELLEHDAQLGRAVAGAAEGLVDVEPEPPLRREVGPELGALFALGVEQCARHRGRAVTLEPAAHRLVQRDVVLGDPDRHDGPLLTVGSALGYSPRGRSTSASTDGALIMTSCPVSSSTTRMSPPGDARRFSSWAAWSSGESAWSRAIRT